MQIPTLTRGRRVLLWGLGCIVVLMLLAWLVLARWLRAVAQEQATAALGRETRIEALHFNPLTLTLALDGLEIAGPAPGAPPLLRIPHAAVNADIRSLFRLAPVVEAVAVQGLELRVARLGDGRYDIDDLIARFKPKGPPAAQEQPARFALYNLSRVEQFYLHRSDEIALIPVFVAFVAPDAVVRLSEEHDTMLWLSPPEARERFSWPRARRALDDALELLGSGDAGVLEEVLRS